MHFYAVLPLHKKTINFCSQYCFTNTTNQIPNQLMIYFKKWVLFIVYTYLLKTKTLTLQITKDNGEGIAFQFLQNNYNNGFLLMNKKISFVVDFWACLYL